MTRQISYGGFSDQLVTAGGFRALVIEVTEQAPQRIISCTASCVPAAAAPTAGQVAGFARLIVYIGSISDPSASVLVASNYDIIGSLSLSRVLANMTVPMGKDVQLFVPQAPGSLWESRAGETLGAALLLPVALDSGGASLLPFNALASLSFFGVISDVAADSTHKYKVV